MLKIGRSENSDGVDVMRLEGKVIGRWVGELRRLCEQVLNRPGSQLILDMSDVTFIDMAGTDLLRELASRDVALVNCSPFAAEQLQIDSDRLP